MFDPLQIAEAALERLKAEDSSFPALPVTAQGRFLVVVESEIRKAFALHCRESEKTKETVEEAARRGFNS